MNLALYQIIIVLVALIFIFKAFSHYFRKEQTIREVIAVTIFWVVVLSITVFPEFYSKISEILGFKDYINAIVIVSLIIAFYAIFKLFVSNDKSEKQLTELVRKIALEEAEKE